MNKNDNSMNDSKVMIKSLRHRLIHGTKWTMIGSGIAQIAGLSVSIVLAQFLGKNMYGEYAIIQSSVAMFGIFAGMAMGLTSTKFVAEFRHIDPKRAGRFIGIPLFLGWVSSIIMAILLSIFAEPIAIHILGKIELTQILRISSPLLIFNTIANVQMASLAGLESFRGLAIGRGMLGILKLPCQLIGVWFGGLLGAIIGLIIADFMTCVFLEIYLRRNCKLQGIRITHRGIRTESKILFHFSFPTLLASLTVGPSNWLCNVLLVNTPGGYGQMGIYNATFQWQSAIRFVPLRMFDVSLPILANLYGLREIKKYYKVTFFSFLAVCLFTLGISLPVIFFSRFIMGLYGEGFEEGYLTLIFMMLAAVFQMCVRVFSQVIQSHGKAWLDFIFCTIRIIILLSLWFFLLEYGAVGLAFSILISYIIIFIIQGSYTIYLWKTDSKGINYVLSN